MDTGKVEYAPDYKSAGSKSTVFKIMKRARLEAEVVQAAKRFNETRDDYFSMVESTDYEEAKTKLGDAVDALLEFEAQQGGE